MIKLCSYLLCLITLLFPAKLYANQSICGEEFSDIQELLTRLSSKIGNKSTTQDGRFIVLIDNNQTTVWNFTTKSNKAHPSVSCRTIVESSGKIGIQTNLICGASKADCDNLNDEYRELDAQSNADLAK